jgi:chromosome segregation ATPase
MHPEYFWKDIFRPIREDNVWELNSKCQLREAINVLKLESSYELEDELYADFGSKQTFKNSATATKHIQKHPGKHQDAFLELIKKGLTKENTIELFEWIIHRPVKVIHDKQAVREEIATYKKQLDANYEEERRKIVNEVYEAKQLQLRFQAILETDEYTEYERMRERYQQLQEDNRTLQSNIKILTSDMDHYKSFYDDMQSRREENLKGEDSAIAYYEKATKSYEQKMKKHEAECDKKVKKAQQDAEEATEKLEKQIKKLKSEVKAYKKEIELTRLRAKAKDSDDSDSD